MGEVATNCGWMLKKPPFLRIAPEPDAGWSLLSSFTECSKNRRRACSKPWYLTQRELIIPQLQPSSRLMAKVASVHAKKRL